MPPHSSFAPSFEQRFGFGQGFAFGIEVESDVLVGRVETGVA